MSVSDDNALRRLAELGQSPWLDFLSRSMLRTGELAELIDRGVRGITSNRDHGRPAVRLTDGLDRASEVLAGLARAGVDLAAVTERLLDEGIRKFAEPYDALHAALDRKAAAYRAGNVHRPAR